MPSAPTADSSARTTVVPTAIVRFARLTAAAVPAGTRTRSGYGCSPRSSEETPVCRTTVATAIPRASSRSSTRALNGRPALGISALPGSPAKMVWKSSSGRAAGRCR